MVAEEGTGNQCLCEENYATDSYQNVLLSLLQFPIWLSERNHSSQPEGLHPPQLTLADLVVPKRLIIISHEFKRSRFLDLHLPAIRSIWPSTEAFDKMDVEYIGIDPCLDEQKIREIKEGDRLRGYGAWKSDLFGTGELLSKKRLERGWNEDGFIEFLSRWFHRDTLDTIRCLLRGSKV